MKKVNKLNIGQHMVYTTKTLANKIGVSEKTILRWIDEGLNIIPSTEEKIMINSCEVTRFIKERQKSNIKE